jgi:hypothetical protein
MLRMPALPLLDIDSRRARDALRADEPCAAGTAAAAGDLAGSAVAVPADAAPVVAVAFIAVLPALLSARRRASASSRELRLVAVCAIINPVS